MNLFLPSSDIYNTTTISKPIANMNSLGCFLSFHLAYYVLEQLNPLSLC